MRWGIAQTIPDLCKLWRGVATGSSHPFSISPRGAPVQENHLALLVPLFAESGWWRQTTSRPRSGRLTPRRRQKGAGCSFGLRWRGIVVDRRRSRGLAGAPSARAGASGPACCWAGPDKAFQPRLSPDGQLVAFLAFIDQFAATRR